MVKTELERSSCYNTITTRKKIKSDDGFEDRRFTCTLRTEHGNTRQVDVLLKANVSKFILKS